MKKIRMEVQAKDLSHLFILGFISRLRELNFLEYVLWPENDAAGSFSCLSLECRLYLQNG